MASSLIYRRLRAPQQDGGILFEPTWQESVQLPATNRRLLDGCDFDLCGHRFQTLRKSARAQLFELASQHTGQYSVCSLPAGDAPIVMSGHQPQLVHPGVWAKNFAMHRMAEEVGGVAVQVIVDNDLMHSHSLPIPAGTVQSPHVVAELFDRFQPPQPFETRHVSDPTLLESFAERVANRIRPVLGEDPLVKKIWPEVVSAVRAGRPLGESFARGRHQLELDWGLRTLEVPLSQLCETTPFRCFLLDLLLRGENVRLCYNRRLAEYRAVHRLRNAAQPLPDLRRDGDWIESPFWHWKVESPSRQPLWCRRAGTTIFVGDPSGPNWELPGAAQSHEAATRQLAALAESGLKLRPRAITNTLFLRLFLSDLFIHGIGGAKYDQITDLLVNDLYLVTPPAFLTLSFTSRLPVEFEYVSKAQITEKQQRLRQIYFHPERFLNPQDELDDQVSNCLERKAYWIEQDPPRGKRKQRHQQIVAVNELLRGFLREKYEKQGEILAELYTREFASQIWSSREWSFVLFPEVFLKNRLLDLRLHGS